MPDPADTRRWVPVAALAVLGAAAVAVFFTMRSSEPAGVALEGTGLSEQQLQDTFAELCRTRALAETQVPAARDLFFGRVHSPLHVIATVAGEKDRRAAARMLEAKNDTEVALNEEAAEPQTIDALDRLLATTAEALRSIGVTTSNCDVP